MKTFFNLCLASVVVLLTNCTNHYVTHNLQRKGKLDRNSSAMVAVPKDGSFAEDEYPGSGRRVAQAVANAFRKHVQKVDVLPEGATNSEQLAAARRSNFAYLVQPSLVHWEDRATQWSGLVDKIQIQIRVLNAANGETIHLGSVSGSSHFFTFVNQPPEQLLVPAVEKYVGELFGGKTAH